MCQTYSALAFGGTHQVFTIHGLMSFFSRVANLARRSCVVSPEGLRPGNCNVIRVVGAAQASVAMLDSSALAPAECGERQDRHPRKAGGRRGVLVRAADGDTKLL